MKTIVTTIKMLLALTMLTGIAYPALVTGIARVFMNEKAGGSLLSIHGKIVGSTLIAQPVDSVIWFKYRPSAVNYNPLPSGGSNLGPTNKNLFLQVKKRHMSFIQENMLHDSTEVPSEMIYASASGLDPHISPRAAFLQVNRIAKARGLNKRQVDELYILIDKMTEEPQFHLFGDRRINVFMLNLELDKIR